MTMIRLVFVVALLTSVTIGMFAQIPSRFRNENNNAFAFPSSTPPSNSIPHITQQGTSLWVGSSKGLALTTNSGRSWENFRGVPEFTTRGIFAVAVKDNHVWTSGGFNQEVNGQSVQTGAGYTYSLNGGSSWSHIPQTLDGRGDSLVTYGINTVEFLPILVDEQNVTFDIALSDTFVWIASWSSGLRKSSDNGTTWQRVVLPSDNRSSISPADTLGRYFVDPRLDNNFLVFSVFVQNDTTIWAGTAGGVNKSIDGGRSWQKFTTLNQSASILGNWVIAIAGQPVDTTYRLWITNWKADLDPGEEFGVSYSDDGGRIWRTFLYGIRAYAFAFKDSITYVATDDGIYRTDDGGQTWRQSGTIIDQVTHERVTSRTFYSVAVIGDTVYAGGTDGFVKTVDNSNHQFGESWQVLRTYQPVGSNQLTYAYPNPFAPDDEIVRFHYATGGQASSVTIEIFDFGMNRVRTLIKDAQRFGSTEYDEIWSGRDDSGTQVANGVYFYRVTVDSNDPVWGKVMVLQ